MGAAEIMPQENRRRQERSVLVVEDDALTRLTVCEFLRDIGLTVVEAATGDEAGQFLAIGSPVDLIFTDITMPGRIQGDDLVALVREKFPRMHIIVASGNLGAARGVEIQHFLQKPYSIEAAAELILNLLGIGANGDSNSSDSAAGDPG